MACLEGDLKNLPPCPPQTWHFASLMHVIKMLATLVAPPMGVKGGSE